MAGGQRSIRGVGTPASASAFQGTPLLPPGDAANRKRFCAALWSSFSLKTKRPRGGSRSLGSIPRALRVPIPARSSSSSALRTRRVSCARHGRAHRGPRTAPPPPAPTPGPPPPSPGAAAEPRAALTRGDPTPCAPKPGGHRGGDEPGPPAPSGSSSAWEPQPRAREGLSRGLHKVPLKKFPSWPDPSGWSVGPGFRRDGANIRPRSRFPGPFQRIPRSLPQLS